jgi:energy-coupling factor transporter transmembrane protein EcfT
LLIVLRAVFIAKLPLSELRTPAPTSTCSWTSLASVCVFFLSWMNSLSCRDVNYADWFILWCSRN